MFFDKGAITILQQGLVDYLIALDGEERSIHSVKLIRTKISHTHDFAIDYTVVSGSYPSTDSILYSTASGTPILTVSEVIRKGTVLDQDALTRYIRFHIPGRVLVEGGVTLCALVRGDHMTYINKSCHFGAYIDPFSVIVDDYVVVRNNIAMLNFEPIYTE